jgi:8-oxo-dGTP pyrophosphatase MutT (NUDIX family)
LIASTIFFANVATSGSRSALQSRNQNMATQIATAELPVIKAAGGILLRRTPGGEEVMVVYRKRHQDWTLPKGKLRDRESFQEAALREVEEETGCRCHLADYLGTISYAQSGVPKVVMFWKMAVVEEKPRVADGEITEALWMPVSAAMERLTHAQERSLLSRFSAARRGLVPIQREPPARLAPEPSGILEAALATTAAPVSGPRRDRRENQLLPWFGFKIPWPVLGKLRWRSPKSRNLQTLQHEKEALQVEVAFLESRNEVLDITWASAAKECLKNMAHCLQKSDLAGSWMALRAARRYAILGLGAVELAARGQVLREEARKMISWRGAAIQKLLATADDHLSAPRIADAIALRDEEEADQKIQGRRLMSRLRLLTVACVVAALMMLASPSGPGAYYVYAPLGLLGLLGSALAAAQSMIQGKHDKRLPGQLMLLVMVIGGALSGLAADSFYKSAAHYFKLNRDYDFAVYLIAFALGYAGQKLLARLSGYSYPPEERAIYY